MTTQIESNTKSDSLQIDSSDVQRYAGQTFITDRNRMYNITQDGRFIGEDSIKGSRIERIGGVTSGNKTLFEDYLARKERTYAEEHLLYPQTKALGNGLCLAIILTKEDEERTGITGFITDPIKEIINIK